MVDYAEQPAPVQMSLFPDAVEVQAASLSALRDLDVPRARRLFEQTRAQNPRLVNLDVIDQALCLLESVLGGAGTSPGPERLAGVVVAAHDEYLAGRLPRPAAGFVDETIARYWRGHGEPCASAAGFLDRDQRVHRGILDLVLGHAATARRQLASSLDSGLWQRADLWACLGDACLALERGVEANACYVRALLVSAAGVDLMRTRFDRIRQLHDELCRAHPEKCALELLLVEGWLQGAIEIPPENGWLDGHVSKLHARAQAGPGSAPEERYRRFALLLYLDRSEAPGHADLPLREEMAALCPDLFERYMHECRTRERGRGSAARSTR